MVLSKIQEWGSRLIFCISKQITDETSLIHNHTVEITLEAGDLQRIPIQTTKRYQLETLLNELSPEQLHDEVDFGQAVGHEIW